MIIKKIELENYGPFLNKQELNLGALPNVKTWKKTLLNNKQFLPLGVIYGENNSGKSILLEVVRKLKNLMNGEYVEFFRHFEDSRPSKISIYFDDFCFSILSLFASREITYTISTTNGEEIASTSNLEHLKDKPFAPVRKLAYRIYFADDSLTYNTDLVKFLVHYRSEIGEVLDNLGFNVDKFDLRPIMKSLFPEDENKITAKETGRVSDRDHVFDIKSRRKLPTFKVEDECKNNPEKFVIQDLSPLNRFVGVERTDVKRVEKASSKSYLSTSFREARSCLPFRPAAVHFEITYGNGRKQLLDNASNSLKRIVKLMPLFIKKSFDIFVVDDVFNCLNTCLLEEIVKFHVFRSNKKQLIFNTNNTHVLSMIENDGVRTDEIYFVEQKRNGASSIYSLGDFKIDNSNWAQDFEKRYLEGRMGATPLIFPSAL